MAYEISTKETIYGTVHMSGMVEPGKVANLKKAMTDRARRMVVPVGERLRVVTYPYGDLILVRAAYRIR